MMGKQTYAKKRRKKNVWLYVWTKDSHVRGFLRPVSNFLQKLNILFLQ